MARTAAVDAMKDLILWKEVTTVIYTLINGDERVHWNNTELSAYIKEKGFNSGRDALKFSYVGM